MTTGILRIQAFAARKVCPGRRGQDRHYGGWLCRSAPYRCPGQCRGCDHSDPACRLSLEEQNTTQRPYAVCSLTASKPGYRTVRIQGVQIFPGQVTLAQPE